MAEWKGHAERDLSGSLESHERVAETKTLLLHVAGLVHSGQNATGLYRSQCESGFRSMADWLQSTTKSALICTGSWRIPRSVRPHYCSKACRSGDRIGQPVGLSPATVTAIRHRLQSLRKTSIQGPPPPRSAPGGLSAIYALPYADNCSRFGVGLPRLRNTCSRNDIQCHNLVSAMPNGAQFH